MYNNLSEILWQTIKKNGTYIKGWVNVEIRDISSYDYTQLVQLLYTASRN